jgi:hypothetical protein
LSEARAAGALSRAAVAEIFDAPSLDARAASRLRIWSCAMSPRSLRSLFSRFVVRDVAAIRCADVRSLCAMLRLFVVI